MMDLLETGCDVMATGNDVKATGNEQSIPERGGRSSDLVSAQAKKSFATGNKYNYLTI